jgi:hypothetical protein
MADREAAPLRETPAQGRAAHAGPMQSVRVARPSRRGTSRAPEWHTLCWAWVKPMKTFILSGSGRILALAFGVALVGSGASKLINGTAGIAIGSIAVLLAIAFAVFALATAIEKHFDAAVLAVVLLPWLAFLGEVGLGLLPRSGAGLLVVAGGVAVAFAVRRRTAPARHPIGFTVARSA